MAAALLSKRGGGRPVGDQLYIIAATIPTRTRTIPMIRIGTRLLPEQIRRLRQPGGIYTTVATWRLNITSSPAV